MNHHIPSPPLLFNFPTQGTLDQQSNCSWCTVRQLCQLTKPSQLLTINAQATIDLNFKHRNTNSTNFNLYSVDLSHRFSYKKESLREKLYSQLFLHPPGVYPLDVQHVGEQPLCEHFCPHCEHGDIFPACPPIICVGVWVGWLVGSPGETWMINSVHPFSLHPLCIGSVVCIMPGWRACVCAQGRRWFPHLREGTYRELLGQLLLAWNSLPLPARPRNDHREELPPVG